MVTSVYIPILSTDPPEKTADLKELHRNVCHRLAMFSMVLGAFLIWVNLPNADYPWVVSLLALGLCGLGFTVTQLTKRNLRLGRWTLIIGSTWLFLIGFQLIDDPWYPFLSLLLIYAHGTVKPSAGLLVALPALLLAFWLNQQGTRAYPLQILVLMMGSGLVLVWINTNTLYTALRWTQTMHGEVNQLLRETRERRAELVRVLKASELTNEMLRRTQSELVFARQEADKARMHKQQFVANISHELRTPLNLILGFSEIMYQSPSVYGSMAWPPKLRQDVVKIYRSSRHLLRMIDDILDLTHFEVLGFMLNSETTNLEDFLTEAADIGNDLFIGSSTQFTTDIAPGLPLVDIDRTRIRQVILNLLNNARRYAPNAEVTLHAHRNRDQVIIRVTDTGPGIPPDQLSLVFEEFHQVDPSLRRENGGAGLGLALSKKFVEAHGGIINVESTVGVGTTFSFHLPVISHFYSHEAIRTNKGATIKPCVLVVTESSATAMMIARHVQELEIIHITPDADLLVEVMHYNPRAIVINGASPGNLPPSIYEQLNIPIIELTFPQELWVQYQLTASDYLVKPVVPVQIIDTLANYPTAQDLLIIDDDSSFIHLVERTIQTTDRTMNVRRAHDGQVGLEAMRTQTPDLVLLDLLMPVMTGYEVIRTMQADPTLQNIPVVLLTSVTYADNVMEYHGDRITLHKHSGLTPMDSVRYLRGLLAMLTPPTHERQHMATRNH